MFNIEYEYFKRYARLASESLNAMVLVWEQMQSNGTEPDALDFPLEYPFNESFDEVVSRFDNWLDTLE